MILPCNFRGVPGFVVTLETMPRERNVYSFKDEQVSFSVLMDRFVVSKCEEMREFISNVHAYGCSCRFIRVRARL